MNKIQGTKWLRSDKWKNKWLRTSRDYADKIFYLIIKSKPKEVDGGMFDFEGIMFSITKDNKIIEWVNSTRSFKHWFTSEKVMWEETSIDEDIEKKLMLKLIEDN